MSLVESYHAAHKARLARIDAAARSGRTIEKPQEVIGQQPAKLQPVPYNYYWSQMWFYDLVSHRPYDTTNLKISHIVDAVSKHFNVSKTDILSQRRTRNIVRPRQICYYLAKKLTLRSLPEIGRRLGGRDHTSALSGIRKIEQLRKTDADIEAAVRAISGKLGGRIA